MQLAVNLLKGVAVGLSNIIPGVSGATMALVLGIYERLIGAIGRLGPQTLKAVFRGRKAFVEEMRRIDAVFLGTLAAGALVAIVAVARLMVYLLGNFHDPTYGFFFGLVAASAVVPYRMIRRKGPGTVVAALVAVACVVGLTLAMSGQERLESAQRKVEIKAAKAAAATVAAGQEPEEVPVSGAPRTPANMVWFFVAGAVAISAMILPGISGSFILLLLGVYFEVLAAINARQLVLLGIFAAGCGVGLLLFTRLLNLLLSRFHDTTVAFLLGLVIGSLYAIWPFKTYGMAGSQRVDLDNIWPAGFGQNELVTLVAAVGGAAIVTVFVCIEIRQSRSGARSA